MDAEGNCLVVSPCNACRISKNGVQACIVRKHNARLTSVKRTDLASRHRQCVKPDQAMTIFKLVDRESGEESVEYAKGMVFQRPCDGCQHLKSCILGGHTLKDWTAEGDEVRQNKRRSSSNKALIAAAGGASSKSLGLATADGSKRGTAPRMLSGTAMEGAALAGVTKIEREDAEEGHLGEGHFDEEKKKNSRSKRRKVGEGAAGAIRGGGLGAASSPAANAASAVGMGASENSQSIAAQLQAMAAAEDLLRQQFQADMRNLDEAEASKLKELQDAEAGLEKIRLTRKITKDNTAEQRKQMAAERQRLTQLRLQEVIREEAEFQQEKEALWNACEAASSGVGPLATRPRLSVGLQQEGLGLAALREGSSGAGAGGGLLLATAGAAPGVGASLAAACSPSSSGTAGSAKLEPGGVVSGFDVVSPWPYFRGVEGGNEDDGGGDADMEPEPDAVSPEVDAAADERLVDHENVVQVAVDVEEEGQEEGLLGAGERGGGLANGSRTGAAAETEEKNESFRGSDGSVSNGHAGGGLAERAGAWPEPPSPSEVAARPDADEPATVANGHAGGGLAERAGAWPETPSPSEAAARPDADEPATAAAHALSSPSASPPQGGDDHVAKVPGGGRSAQEHGGDAGRGGEEETDGVSRAAFDERNTAGDEDGERGATAKMSPSAAGAAATSSSGGSNGRVERGGGGQAQWNGGLPARAGEEEAAAATEVMANANGRACISEAGEAGDGTICVSNGSERKGGEIDVMSRINIGEHSSAARDRDALVSGEGDEEGLLV